MIKCKRGLVPIFIGHLHLHLAAASIQCEENRDITEKVDKVVHSMYAINVRYAYCVQKAIGYRSPESSLSLGYKQDWYCPIYSDRFENIPTPASCRCRLFRISVHGAGLAWDQKYQAFVCSS